MKLRQLVWLVLGVAGLLTGTSSAAAQEDYQSGLAYVCYWTGDYWLYASQYQYDADRLVEWGQAIYPDEFGYCPSATPWELGMDPTPMAGYCSWVVSDSYPGQGWYLGLAPAYLAAEWVADETDGTEVWLDWWDGTCPDYPAPGAWYGEWTDEFWVIHYPE